jgi:hypothetical protein
MGLKWGYSMIELPWPFYTLAYTCKRPYNRYTAVPPSIFPFKNCAELSKTGNKNGEQSVLMVDGVVVKTGRAIAKAEQTRQF